MADHGIVTESGSVTYCIFRCTDDYEDPVMHWECIYCGRELVSLKKALTKIECPFLVVRKVMES